MAQWVYCPTSPSLLWHLAYQLCRNARKEGRVLWAMDHYTHALLGSSTCLIWGFQAFMGNSLYPLIFPDMTDLLLTFFLFLFKWHLLWYYHILFQVLHIHSVLFHQISSFKQRTRALPHNYNNVSPLTPPQLAHSPASATDTRRLIGWLFEILCRFNSHHERERGPSAEGRGPAVHTHAPATRVSPRRSSRRALFTCVDGACVVTADWRRACHS